MPRNTAFERNGYPRTVAARMPRNTVAAMTRVILAAGWPGLPEQPARGELRVISAPRGAESWRRPEPWRELAESLDVELSASWLVLRAGPPSRPLPAAVRGAFRGCVAAEDTAGLATAVRAVQRDAARSRVLTDRAAVEDRCSRMRRAGRRIVFTNGVFDLLHVGHVRLLRAARALGDALVVGINSDDSARRLKGRARPVVSQFARAELVAAVRGVDLCAIFEEDTPRELLRCVRPDILAKGSEYALSQVIGKRMVESWGGRVVLIPHVEGWSSTEIAGKVARK
jgi:rfaE bifunctional protein nucleotidyltransferase chain/domain